MKYLKKSPLSMKEDKTKHEKDIVQGSDRPDQWEVLSGKLNSEKFLQLCTFIIRIDRKGNGFQFLKENIWFIVLIVFRFKWVVKVIV